MEWGVILGLFVAAAVGFALGACANSDRQGLEEQARVLADVKADRERIKAERSKVYERFDGAAKLVGEANARRDEYRLKADSLEGQVRDLHSDVEQVVSQRDALTVQVGDLKAANDELRKQRDEAREIMALSDECLIKVREENDRLADSLALEREDCLKARTELVKLMKEHSVAEEQYQALCDEKVRKEHERIEMRNALARIAEEAMKY